MKIMSIVGARPNFMKIAPFVHAIEAHNNVQRSTFNVQRSTFNVQHILVHTGQHYDPQMSGSFFDDLDIPRPDVNLEIGSGSHAYQVGQTMIAFEPVMLSEKPDWVVVLGDVNATVACSLTARKHQIRVAHIEAGLRSGDMTMPEEINRLVTDRLSNLLLTTCRFADENLAAEAIPPEQIRRVGNIMIDTLEEQRPKAVALSIAEVVDRNRMPQAASPAASGLRDRSYSLLTLHRPSNVDNPEVLERLVHVLLEMAGDLPMIFPVHPRTVDRLKRQGLWLKLADSAAVCLTQPLGYHDMLRLNMSARVVLTDSGGLQEECAVLGTPCLTLRWNTERPITLVEHEGTNRLVGNDPDRIRAGFEKAMHDALAPHRPPLWDGHTAERVLAALL